MWKGGPLECGVLESGSRALSEHVWVGLRPSTLEGVSEAVSECRGGALAGGAGAGLGLCTAGGRLRGQRIRPGAQQAPRCLGGQGKRWPRSRLFLCAPPPPSPPGSLWSPLDP